MTTEIITLVNRDPHYYFERGSSLAFAQAIGDEPSTLLRGGQHSSENLQGPWSGVVIVIYSSDEIRQISFSRTHGRC